MTIALFNLNKISNVHVQNFCFYIHFFFKWFLNFTWKSLEKAKIFRIEFIYNFIIDWLIIFCHSIISFFRIIILFEIYFISFFRFFERRASRAYYDRSEQKPSDKAWQQENFSKSHELASSALKINEKNGLCHKVCLKC